MNFLVETLYVLSSALLIPVIIVLICFVIWALLEIGGFFREYLERREQKAAWQSFVNTLSESGRMAKPSEVAAFFQHNPYTGLLGIFSSQGRKYCDSDLHLGKLISDLEIEASSRLARMSLGVRLGPMLGLMGTLIPLGPALIGLSTGNIQEMAHNLVVAFSTTVLGLLVGGMCYGMWLTRRQWYSHDLADIEYIYHCLQAEGVETSGPVNSQPQQELLSSPSPARQP